MGRVGVGMAASVAVWPAVIGYAKTLALEVGKDNITVNTLVSGLFDTPLPGFPPPTLGSTGRSAADNCFVCH